MIGYKSFKQGDFNWRFLQKGIIPLSPPHISPKITHEQAKKILKKKAGFFIRWDQNFDSTRCKEWWHIIKDIPECFDSYDRKTRSQIRKGKKLNTIRQCEKSTILEHAYPVYKEVFTGYHNAYDTLLTEKEFKKSIVGLPNETEFWGAFNRETGNLIAFSENIVMNNACFYSTMWLTSLARKSATSFALFHTMNEHYLNKKQLQYVTAGSRSIAHPTNIQFFLQDRFKFRKAYSELNIVYAPYIRPIVRLLSYGDIFFKKSPMVFFQKLHSFLEQDRISKSCKGRAQ